MDRNETVPAWAGALVGLVSGGVALGIAQLVAGLSGPETFPVVAVGDVTVDLTPAPVKDFAINTFGESDKTVLFWGVLVVLAGVAAVIGVLARRRLAYGLAGLAGFGVIGVLAVVTRPDAAAWDVLPTVVGTVAAACALSWLLHRATPVTPSDRPIASRLPLTEEGAPTGPAGPTGGSTGGPTGPPTGPAGGRERGRDGVERPGVMRAGGEVRTFDRRRLLTGAAGGVVVAGAAAVLGQQLAGRRSVDAARVGVALPRPAMPAKPIPAGADFRIPGLSPFVTKNADFYRVDTALVVPQVNPNDWTLRIHGLVERPVELTYADLLRMPLVEADVTLACVSNPVGGPYVGNARWLGVRMAEVLRQSGLRTDADMLLSTSADGFTCGTPVDVVMDGRDALFAVAMNGEPLPVEHGFPVRQVV
ncbi:MAG TPA: molybdopterin-dependent oxidoreductase, partial [Nonomuraea sp.]|nr:molybdopterin-dependent oxidoreductase [Nonomuraea sp.]